MFIGIEFEIIEKTNPIYDGSAKFKHETEPSSYILRQPIN